MKKSRFTESQIQAILHEGESKPIPDVCERHKISTWTFYNWRRERANPKETTPHDFLARRDRDLKEENERLRRMVAAQAIELFELNDKLAS